MSAAMPPTASTGGTDADQPGPVSLDACRVLIVDDNATNRKVLSIVVGKMGITDVETAADGVEGLETLERFAPDLVLLDVMMPTMDGFEMCRRLRANPKWRDVPVLIQTSLSAEDERAQCFEVGATDMVSRPFNYAELQARIRIHLEKQNLIRDLTAFQARLRQELTAARNAQLGLLPRPERVAELSDRFGVDITVHFETSSELGGDFYDLFAIDDRRLGLILADFTGHGVNAAVNTFRLNTLLAQDPPPLDPAPWLAKLSDSLNRLLPMGQFATFFYGILDVTTRRLDYAAAGSPGPIFGVAPATGGAVAPEAMTVLETSGHFLGLLPGATYQNRSVDLPPGASLVLYSDVLLEAGEEDGTALYEEGLVALVAETLGTEKGGRLQFLLDGFFARTKASRPLDDDLTAVWIELP